MANDETTKVRTKNARRGRLTDSAFKYMVIGLSALVVAFFAVIALVLINSSYYAIAANGIQFFFGTVWDVSRDIYGAAPAILGTVVSGALAVLMAIPISLAISIYFTEYAPRKARFYLSIFIDLLAAIPSVIFGIWGLWIIAPLAKEYVQEPVIGAIGWVPLFSGPAYGISISLASLVLTIMVIPIITSFTTELLSRTPSTLKEGMGSLGATKWETARHVSLPFARVGIFAAIILALGRAFGETMAVTMIIGNSYQWPFASSSIFSPATTITSKIASELYEAFSTLQLGSLIELSLILLVISLAINIASRMIMNRLSRGVQAR
jgi:phosphate transport system permease protein